MNDYQREQLAAWRQIEQGLTQMSTREKQAIATEIAGYLRFRHEVEKFIDQHFNKHCTISCYQNNRSACCGKDSILTFWADLVINAINTDSHSVKAMMNAIHRPVYADKCIYLSRQGCCWHIRPLVCLMFLCDAVQQEVFSKEPDAGRQWEAFCSRARSFRWPDRSVLFDRLEARFLARDCFSPLMYLHTSPGLLRVKKKAGML